MLSQLIRRTDAVTVNKIMVNCIANTFSKFRSPSLAMQRCSSNVTRTDTLPRNSPGNLPKLPLPTLQLTLGKYLRSVQPLVSSEEFSLTQDLAKKFAAAGGVGQKLQKILESRYAATENWLSDWWLQTAYLEFRWPVVVYSSPGMIFPMQDFSSRDNQLLHAAKVIAAAVDYKQILDSGSLPEESMGGEPLDMSQYYKILGTCRVPGVSVDSITFHGHERPRHVAVACNNHFFSLNVYDSDGEPLSVQQICAGLQDIVKESQNSTIPIGILTSENRNNWGQAYEILVKDKGNLQSVKSIQSSLFVIAIDAANPDAASSSKETSAALQAIHGHGSQYNAGNRWFDKTVQFIIGTRGEVGITYEHSPSEGPPIATLLDHIVSYIAKNPDGQKSSTAAIAKPQRLHFNPQNLSEQIEMAKKNIDSLVNDLDLRCFTFKSFGKNFVKAQRLSPDSFIQMAIQLAFYRIHGVPGAHYESASTRKFIHGRTETIRSCSVESVAFAKAVLDAARSNQERATLLRAAVEGHKNYTKDAINGLGVDRHLLGLKLAAIENGFDIPKLFLDTSYSRSTHFRLSTSQVSAKSNAVMGYGPLVPDGYGCCYNPRNDQMNFAISAFNSSPQTRADQFCEALEQSLHDMHDILVVTQKSKL